MALVLALWAVALFSMLALGFTGSVRTQVDLVETAKDRLESEMLADAAVHLAILALIQANNARALSADPGSAAEQPEGPIALVDDATGQWGWSGETPLRVDATPYAWRDSGSEVTIHFEAESGKLDLNAVSGELLLSQLQVLGVSQSAAWSIADAFVQYRSERSDQIERMRGTGQAKEEYAAHRPFLSVDEIQNVDGVTRAVFALVESSLTVYSGRAAPDPGVASSEVLAALAAVPRSSTTGGALLMLPSETLDASEPSLSAFPVASGGSARNIYTVRTDAVTDSGYHFVREIVVELPQGGPARYLIHRWTQGWSR